MPIEVTIDEFLGPVNFAKYDRKNQTCEQLLAKFKGLVILNKYLLNYYKLAPHIYMPRKPHPFGFFFYSLCVKLKKSENSFLINWKPLWLTQTLLITSALKDFVDMTDCKR